MSNLDHKIVEEIAKAWVEFGGDGDGFILLHRRIYERITEIKDEAHEVP